MYSDDISLMKPSLTGLQHIVDICSEYCVENSIIFNEKISVCIQSSNDGNEVMKDIKHNGASMEWESKLNMWETLHTVM